MPTLTAAAARRTIAREADDADRGERKQQAGAGDDADAVAVLDGKR